MLIDPLREYTSEEIAALSPTVPDMMELVNHHNKVHRECTEEQVNIMRKNAVTMCRIIGRENISNWIKTNYPSPPEPPTPVDSSEVASHVQD